MAAMAMPYTGSRRWRMGVMSSENRFGPGSDSWFSPAYTRPMIPPVPIVPDVTVRRITAILLAASLPLLLAGCQSAHDARPAGTATPSQSMHRFLALGDSYTIGESVGAGDRWPNQLVRSLRQKGINVADPEIIARTGWTTDELSRAIDAAQPQGPYDLVTLLIGVNNQYRGRDAEQYRGEFRMLLARSIAFARGNAAHVVVISIPDWGATPFAAGRDREKIALEIDRYNAINREETLKAGARYTDITPISREVTTHPELAAADGLHPSAQMYARWIPLIEAEVVAALR